MVLCPATAVQSVAGILQDNQRQGGNYSRDLRHAKLARKSGIVLHLNF
jgi:hypothetical protein